MGDTLKDIQYELNRMNDELLYLYKRQQSLGLFAGKKKKELQAKIDDLEERKRNLEAKLYAMPVMSGTAAPQQNDAGAATPFTTNSGTQAGGAAPYPTNSGTQAGGGTTPYATNSGSQDDSSTTAYMPNMVKIQELAAHLKSVYENAFAQSEYTIEYSVKPGDIDRQAAGEIGREVISRELDLGRHKGSNRTVSTVWASKKDSEDEADYLYPVHFLFRKQGVPVLAVACCSPRGYRRPRVAATEEFCSRKRIPYIRFFCSMTNLSDYVIERTKKALAQ